MINASAADRLPGASAALTPGQAGPGRRLHAHRPAPIFRPLYGAQKVPPATPGLRPVRRPVRRISAQVCPHTPSGASARRFFFGVGRSQRRLAGHVG